MLATHNHTPSTEGAFVMTATPRRLKPEELTELVRQVQALRAVTKMTGVFTSRRIGSLLEGLSTEDMVEVGKALQLKPREMPRTTAPTFNR